MKSVSKESMTEWQLLALVVSNLYSDVQRADDIVVTLPAKAGEKNFQPEQKVKLINPRITEMAIHQGRGFTNYILLADDMLPVESK